jgi:hypothetical protein
MELKSMKLDPPKEEECKPCDVMYGKSDRPEYPWGLCVRLDDELLKKLGITDLPAVGAELMLEAKVKVVSTASNEYEGGARRNVELQITDMGIGSKAE